jgi:hypothetical protein
MGELPDRPDRTGPSVAAVHDACVQLHLAGEVRPAADADGVFRGIRLDLADDSLDRVEGRPAGAQDAHAHREERGRVWGADDHRVLFHGAPRILRGAWRGNSDRRHGRRRERFLVQPRSFADNGMAPT